jgi:hypothetical protein
MATISSRRPLRALILALMGAAGCTLVNGFDDVKPLIEGAYEAGASQADGNLPDAPAVDSGPGPAGAIVMGALAETDGSLTSVLTVLDPATGNEMAPREKMVVSAIRYDGLRDIWYIFEASGKDFVTGPNEGTVLHVRSLDRASGAWSELSKLDVPTLQSYDSVAVVRERIGYVSYAPLDAGLEGGPVAIEFSSFDTSNPAALKPFPRLPLPATPAPLGALATRSTTGPGGTINLVRLNTGACAPGCAVEFIRVQVPTNGGAPSLGDITTVGSTTRFALPGFVAVASTGRDVLILPPVAPDAGVPTTFNLLDPVSYTPDGVPVEHVMKDVVLHPAAVAECPKIVFVVGTNADTNLHAVPLATGGTSTFVPTDHSGQAVYFESSSSTVLAPFSQGGGKKISAFKLEGTALAPTLRERQAPDWAPPQDLRPVVFAVREPLPVVCP